MQDYTRTYLDAFGLDETDFVPCEICAKKATEITEIIKDKKVLYAIENLLAVCSNCEIKYNNETDFIPLLLKIHKKRLDIENIECDSKWFDFYIKLHTKNNVRYK